MAVETRRHFLKTTGVLSIGFSLLGVSCLQRTEKEGGTTFPFHPVDDSQINAWLQVLSDGRVKILSGKMELGQGIKTAIVQVAAEELNTSMHLIDIHIAETDVTPNEGYTVGSMSIETSAMAVRNAAASAREILIRMAAEKFIVPENSLTLKDLIITGDDVRISIGDLLEGKQVQGKVTTPTTILAKTERKIVGQPVIRKDIENMVVGKQHFIHDLRFEGMVHARIIRPQSYTAELLSVDNTEFDANGLLKLIRIGNFLGVISEEEYQAIQLARAIGKVANWKVGDALPTGQGMEEHILSLPSEPDPAVEKGLGKNGINGAKVTHEASYFKPYLMHAANGPSCALAIFQNGKMTIWSHSQGIHPLRSAISQLVEIPESDIHIIGVPGSACYGHNGADDVAAEAALLAINYPGRHVRLQWMREEEHGWEPYGTAMRMALKAGVDQKGKIQGWDFNLWSDVHGTRPFGSAENLLPARYLGKGYQRPVTGFKGGAPRNAEPYYEIHNIRMQTHFFKGPLRRSALRALGAYANVFAIESFMDELALKAGIKPMEFRTNHLKDPRAIHCLERLEDKINKIQKGDHEGLGHAFARYKNSSSYCAVAVWVRVDRKSGTIQLKKMWAVVDSGEIINPDGLKNQIEGGMIQSASWALKEEVKFDQNHITCLDWITYPILRYNEIPEIEVELIEQSDEPPLGAGEASQGPATAAIVNAIYDATQVRIRQLPIQRQLLLA